MKANLWITGRVCRVLVQDSEGRVIDLCDEWNNVASAQSWLYDTYPEATQKVIRGNPDTVRELNAEWDRCAKGVS